MPHKFGIFVHFLYKKKNKQSWNVFYINRMVWNSKRNWVLHFMFRWRTTDFLIYTFKELCLGYYYVALLLFSYHYYNDIGWGCFLLLSFILWLRIDEVTVFFCEWKWFVVSETIQSNFCNRNYVNDVDQKPAFILK